MRLGKKNNVSVETEKNEQIMANIPTPNSNMNDVNRIAVGTKLIGDMASGNDIRIDGEFEGRLYCAGRVVVGEKAVLKEARKRLAFCVLIAFFDGLGAWLVNRKCTQSTALRRPQTTISSKKQT